MSTSSLWRNILRHPFIAWLTFPRILWQAGILYYRKKLEVYSKPEPRSNATIRRAVRSRFERFAERRVCGFLDRIEEGRLVLELPDGGEHAFGDPEAEAVRLQVRDRAFFKRILLGGDIGFSEAWMEGDFDCDDIREPLRLFVRNRAVLDTGGLVLSFLGWAAQRTRHLLRHNSLRGSKRNIEEHYDLSNDFFETFLDRTMTYSCGLFLDEADSLEDAQRNKLRAAVSKARIGGGDHVLEIGTGWGSFAIETVRATGCRVTSITLSEEQKALAEARVREAGLDDKIDIRICDYRKMSGQFDRIVSIEMIEAVGHRHFSDFFQSLERLLKPDGLVFLQVITIPDQRYRQYIRSVDFIQAHIFPGGALPSITVMCENMTKHSGLLLEHLENFPAHYVRTLREWRRRFLEHREEIGALGFDAVFRRKWEYYFAYCEVGFATRMINLHQMVLTREQNT